MNHATKTCPSCGHALPTSAFAPKKVPPPLPRSVPPVASTITATPTPAPTLVAPPARTSDVAPKAIAPDPRRQFDRCDVEVGVDIASDHNFYTGFTSNISEGGIFIATHVLRPAGSVLAIRFTLPGDDEPVAISTVVRWVREHNELSNVEPGLGLQFVDLRPEDAARISAFIRASREPLFYDD